jgi:hypothetical protein
MEIVLSKFGVLGVQTSEAMNTSLVVAPLCVRSTVPSPNPH